MPFLLILAAGLVLWGASRSNARPKIGETWIVTFKSSIPIPEASQEAFRNALLDKQTDMGVSLSGVTFNGNLITTMATFLSDSGEPLKPGEKYGTDAASLTVVKTQKVS